MRFLAVASNTHYRICMNRRLEALKAELARRLGPILPDVPPELFEEVIHVVASLQSERESRHRAPQEEQRSPLPNEPPSARGSRLRRE